MLRPRPILIAASAVCALAFAICSPVTAEDKVSAESGRRVEIRFVGGEKEEPLAGIEVLLTRGSGDEQKKFGPFTTSESGTVVVSLPPAFYSLHLSSDKELPYLPVEKLWKGETRGPRPSLDLLVTDTGAQKWLNGEPRDDGAPCDPPRITYSLLRACELVLRAVDAETGKGLSGTKFYEENAVGEDWAHDIDGENLGWREVADDAPGADEANLSDSDGNFKRLVSASGGYAYGVAHPPAGYKADGPAHEVDLDILYGQKRAEQVFHFRRVKDQSQ